MEHQDLKGKGFCGTQFQGFQSTVTGLGMVQHTVVGHVIEDLCHDHDIQEAKRQREKDWGLQYPFRGHTPIT